MQFSPNRYVDITRMESRKKAACYAHASQIPDRYYELQDQVSASGAWKAAICERRPLSGSTKVPSISSLIR